MNVKTLTVGPLQENCYLAWNETGNGFIIDPGDNAQQIKEAISKNGFSPQAILLTHGHVDHIRAIPELASTYNIEVFLRQEDHKLYSDPRNEVFPYVTAAQNLPEPVTEPIQATGLNYQVLETPGHTRGGCSFYFDAEGTVFTGDTLFCGSIGRTDLPGADEKALLESIRQQLLGLPPDTVVYPGHGPATTIAEEKSSNPFL